MSRDHLFVFLILLLPLFVSLPVFADYGSITSPVIGSWVLDKVYESASQTDRYAVDPENAASLYAESGNIYAFLAGGTAEWTMEGETLFGYWEKQDDGYRMVINSTARYSDKSVKTEPDFDPPYEMTLFYDADQNVLHRYWKDDAPEAAYHDLDFVYKRMPQGIWMMTKVYSFRPGQEPRLLDPDVSQSLYAESVNRLSLYRYKVNNMVRSETGYIDEPGTLKSSWDSWLLTFDDGFETRLFFDDRAEVLHRYWVETATDSLYDNLDFVYEMIPVRSWRLNYVFDMSTEQEPVLLDPEKKADLYQESRYCYRFGPNGRGGTMVSDKVYDQAEWIRNDDKILWRFDDGRAINFVYDVKADVLHLYETADDHDLDFVYLKD